MSKKSTKKRKKRCDSIENFLQQVKQGQLYLHYMRSMLVLTQC